MHKKAQIFSLDVLFALSLFFLVLLLSFSLTRLAEQRSVGSLERAEMEMKAQMAMDSLLLTSGNPGNWGANESFSSLGLVTQGNYILDIIKVQALVEKNSSYTNTSLALGITGYHTYIHIIDSSEILYSFGMDAPYTAHDVVIVQRLAVLDDTPVLVEVGVWQ